MFVPAIVECFTNYVYVSLSQSNETDGYLPLIYEQNHKEYQIIQFSLLQYDNMKFILENSSRAFGRRLARKDDRSEIKSNQLFENKSTFLNTRDETRNE
jgi:hypothetical protein